MKRQTLFSIMLIAALMVFSIVLTPAVFAGTSTHTITIINNSNTTLLPASNSHRVTYNSADPACGTVPPDSCSQLDMTAPSSIPANSSAVVNMAGPTGCNISMWQTYWKPGKSGKLGDIHCSKSPVNVCNSINRNYTCTISQGNVDSANRGDNVSGTVQ